MAKKPDSTLYRTKALAGTLTKPEALEWFKLLYENTMLYLKKQGIVSPKIASTSWKYGKPLGVCSHITMTPDVHSAFDWYCSNNTSIAFLIHYDGTIYSLVKCWEAADVHEPLCTGVAVGVELVNVGQLDYKNGVRTWWLNGWTTALDQTFPKPVKTKSGIYSQEFTYKQVESDLAVKRALAVYYDFQESQFFNHSDVNLFCPDPGEHYPKIIPLCCTREPVDMKRLTSITGQISMLDTVSPMEYPEVLQDVQASNVVGVLNTKLCPQSETIIDMLITRFTKLGYACTDFETLKDAVVKYNSVKQTNLPLFSIRTKLELDKAVRKGVVHD